MAILRSRAVEGQPLVISHQGADRVQGEWQARLLAAQEEGRRKGLAEAAARISEAERRATQAEQTASTRIQAEKTEYLARFEPSLAALAGAATRLDQLQKQLVQESEAEIVRLALAVAAAIMRRVVHMDPAWMDAVVKRALTQVPDRRAVTLRMHATDAASVKERLQEVTSRIAGLEKIVIVEDATLPRGSCILQSQGTRLDVSLAGCWERLADELLDAAPSSDCAIIVRPGDSNPPENISGKKNEVSP